MVVYKITNKINGNCYIGQTTKSLEERFAEHCLPSSKCYALSGAIKKYGKQNFSIELLVAYNNFEDLNNAEEYFIAWYNCLAPNGYNLTSGGKQERLSEVSRQKSSISHKKLFAEGKTPWLPKKGESRSPQTQFKKGIIPWMKGKPSSNRTPILCLNNGKIYPSQRAAALELGLRPHSITGVVKGKYKHTKGYRFEYVKAQHGI